MGEDDVEAESVGKLEGNEAGVEESMDRELQTIVLFDICICL